MKKNFRLDRAPRFSLVELLVAVAVIALLVAVLLPALGKARDTAKTIQCVNQLKQLATSTFYYIDDNNDYFPYNGGGMDSWGWNLLPYTSNTTIARQKTEKKPITAYLCPADKSPSGWPLPTGTSNYNFPVSYGQNYFFTAGWSWPNYVKNLRFRHYFRKPSIIIMDLDSDFHTAVSYNIANTLSACRHNGRWNASYLDAHVDRIGLDKVADVDSYYLP